jgi:hypothetical protein
MDISGMLNETHAISESVRFRARFSKREITEVASALDLYDEMKRLKSQGFMLTAEHEDGRRRTLLILGLS